MKQLDTPLPIRLLLVYLTVFTVFLLGFHAGRAQAANLPAKISTTITITEDSQLVSDVTCAVPLTVAGANPCIAFGKDNIKLQLNGHTITGPVDPPTGCSLPSDAMFGVGVEASGRTGVIIEGPGVIQKFERWGILLLSSSAVTVTKVTANRNCWSGMQTIDTANSNFVEDTWINNAAGSNGAACGGICLDGASNNNRMLNSKFYGNGSLDYANGNVDFGVGFNGTSSGNLVEGNDIGGNAHGIRFKDTASSNVVRHNIIAGNPPAQVLKSFTASNQSGADIAFDPAFSGSNNIIEDNFCLTYFAGGGPTTAACPNTTTGEAEDSVRR